MAYAENQAMVGVDRAIEARPADALEMSRPKREEQPDAPTPSHWQIGRMEVNGQTYERAIFVSFPTIEEYRAALREVDGWFNS